MTIKVLIVDDSAVVRQVLRDIFTRAAEFEVVGAAQDPIFAKQTLAKVTPDVIVLDIEMPRMDGLTFLRELMKTTPIPVVICSSLATQGAELSVQALEAGAVEIISKPELGVKGFLSESEQRILRVVKGAAASRPKAQPAEINESIKAIEPLRASTASSSKPAFLGATTDKIIAIGTSTGGVQALEHLLTRLPATVPGIVIVQHMPEKFTHAFAKRLNLLCEVDVSEAKSEDRIIPGRVLIAPGGFHLEVVRSGAQYLTRVFQGPAVSRHCPSVDVLFRSVAKNVGQNALGVIMTGMGDDGAKGMLEMHHAKASTIAQDERSCVVFGMPKEAIKLGAVNEVLSLDRIAERLANWA